MKEHQPEYYFFSVGGNLIKTIMMEINWSALQGICAILSIVITLLGYIFLFRQITQTNKGIQHSSGVAIYSISSEFYKFLADNSKLRPYFYNNKEVIENDNDQDKLLAMCEYLADFFEFVIIESKGLDPRIFESWKDYMSVIYKNSPVFRFYLSKYKSNYTPELLAVFKNLITNHNDGN
jgi:hypothetical protein